MTLVTINYNDWETTKQFVEKIRNYRNIDHIIVVDNCSKDDSYRKLCELNDEKVTVILSDKNGGYGYGNNYGIRYAKNTYQEELVLICNPDVEFSEQVVDRLIQTIKEDDSVAVAAPIMKNRDRQIVPGTAWEVPTGWGYVFSSTRIIQHFAKSGRYDLQIQNGQNVIDVGCVAGSMLMVRVDDFLKCGAYDEDMFLYCEETVLGIRMQRIHKKTKLLLDEYFYHYHSKSITKSFSSIYRQEKMIWKSRKYVLKKYYGFNKIAIAFVTVCEYMTYFINWLQKKY